MPLVMVTIWMTDGINLLHRHRTDSAKGPPRSFHLSNIEHKTSVDANRLQSKKKKKGDLAYHYAGL